MLSAQHVRYECLLTVTFAAQDGKESGMQVVEKVDRWPQRGYSFCEFDVWFAISLYILHVFVNAAE